MCHKPDPYFMMQTLRETLDLLRLYFLETRLLGYTRQVSQNFKYIWKHESLEVDKDTTVPIIAKNSEMDVGKCCLKLCCHLHLLGQAISGRDNAQTMLSLVNR